MFKGTIRPGKGLILFLAFILSSGMSLGAQLRDGQKPFRFVAHRGASYLAP